MRTYMWVCPFCKEESLDYWPIQLEGDQCYFKWECDNCKAKGEEWYNMDFIWHENLQEWVLDTNQDKNGNNVWENAIK